MRQIEWIHVIMAPQLIVLSSEGTIAIADQYPVIPMQYTWNNGVEQKFSTI